MHGYWKETKIFEKKNYSDGTISSLNISSSVELSVVERTEDEAGDVVGTNVVVGG
jgi:hypothetical protein